MGRMETVASTADHSRLLAIAKRMRNGDGWRTRVVGSRIYVYDTWAQECLVNYRNEGYPRIRTFKAALAVMNKNIEKAYRLRLVGSRLEITDREGRMEVFGESVSQFILT